MTTHLADLAGWCCAWFVRVVCGVSYPTRAASKFDRCGSQRARAHGITSYTFNTLRNKVFGPLPPGGGANLTTLTHLGGGSDPPSI